MAKGAITKTELAGVTAETVMATTSKTLRVGFSTPLGVGEVLISLSSVVVLGVRQKRKV
jgi:hypothetical protein